MLRLRNVASSRYSCIPITAAPKHWIVKPFCLKPLASSLHTTVPRFTDYSDQFSPKELPEYGKYASEDFSETILQSIADSTFVQGLEKLLISVHGVGLPWWLTIALTTVSLRLFVTVPLMTYSLKNHAKMAPYYQALKLLELRLRKEMKDASVKYNWDENMKRRQFLSNTIRHKKELKEKLNPPSVFKRYLVPLFQLPLWVGMSFALRDLTLFLQRPLITPDMIDIHTQLASQGLLWFSNLCQPDMYFILPLITCAGNLAVIELHGMSQKSLPLTYVLRTLCVLMVPIASQLPSAVVLYWSCSSLFGVGQALALRTPYAKKYFDVSKYSLKVVNSKPPEQK